MLSRWTWTSSTRSHMRAASAEPTITAKLSKCQQHGQIVLLCLFWRARFHVFRWLITFDLEGREKHGWYKCVGNGSLEVR